MEVGSEQSFVILLLLLLYLLLFFLNLMPYNVFGLKQRGVNISVN